MKTTTIITKTKLLICSFLLSSFFSIAQSMAPAPAEKAVVYFSRPSILGGAINFNFFDNDQFIGKIAGGQYFRYECAPGEHLFWASSENVDFVTAELEAGKSYVVEVGVGMGAIKARVNLTPVDARQIEAEYQKKIKKQITTKLPQTFDQSELEKVTLKKKDWIAEKLAKYNQNKAEYAQKRILAYMALAE